MRRSRTPIVPPNIETIAVAYTALRMRLTPVPGVKMGPEAVGSPEGSVSTTKMSNRFSPKSSHDSNAETNSKGRVSIMDAAKRIQNPAGRLTS